MIRIASTVIIAALAACGGASKPGAVGGSGSSAGSAADCAKIEAGVKALYEADAMAAKEATFVADNVAMVMKDCAHEPGRVAPCAAGAKSVAQLESECLIPLDQEGTEGDKVGQ